MNGVISQPEHLYRELGHLPDVHCALLTHPHLDNSFPFPTLTLPLYSLQVLDAVANFNFNINLMQQITFIVPYHHRHLI